MFTLFRAASHPHAMATYVSAPSARLHGASGAGSGSSDVTSRAATRGCGPAGGGRSWVQAVHVLVGWVPVVRVRRRRGRRRQRRRRGRPLGVGVALFVHLLDLRVLRVGALGVGYGGSSPAVRIGGAVRFADGHPFPPRPRPRPEELATPEAETDRDKRKGVSKERSVHTNHHMDMGTTTIV